MFTKPEREEWKRYLELARQPDLRDTRFMYLEDLRRLNRQAIRRMEDAGLPLPPRARMVREVCAVPECEVVAFWYVGWIPGRNQMGACLCAEHTCDKINSLEDRELEFTLRPIQRKDTVAARKTRQARWAHRNRG